MSILKFLKIYIAKFFNKNKDQTLRLHNKLILQDETINPYF